MSSFGDGNRKTRLEEELDWFAREYYSQNFYEDSKAQRQFMLDVLEVLIYMCRE